MRSEEIKEKWIRRSKIKEAKHRPNKQHVLHHQTSPLGKFERPDDSPVAQPPCKVPVATFWIEAQTRTST